MIFRQFIAPHGGCASYLVGCERAGQSAVIDPLADVGPYLADAAALGLRITHVIETHAHADHLSGAYRLSRVTRAPLLTHEPLAAGVPHCDVEDEEEHEIGLARLTLLLTPGHTGGSLAVLVTDRARANGPPLLLSGDTLLVGEVGRPEPEAPGCERRLAEQLYDSVFERLLRLPDDVTLYPAHVSPGASNGGPAARSVSTIAVERRSSAALQLAQRSEFVRFVLAGVTPLADAAHETRRRNLGYAPRPGA
jgi:hydroxyacylglutathione hydrolase